MAKQTAVISCGPPGGATAGADFALEQKPWPKKNPAKFADWLKERAQSPTGGSLLWAYTQYLSNCNADGDLIVTLRVRLQDLATPYALRAFYGVISPAATFVEETRQEFLAFELATEQAVDFGLITAWKWNGEAYDVDNNIVTDPPVTINGRTATTPTKILGVLEVTVTEQLYEHTLTITPRTPTAAQAAEDDLNYDELYASTVAMFCLDQIKKIDINMPENFGTCDGGWGSSVNVPEDPDEPLPTFYDVTFEVFDYCTGDIISNANITVSSTDADGNNVSLNTTSGGKLRLSSGSHLLLASAPGYTPSHEDDLSENDKFSLSELAE